MKAILFLLFRTIKNRFFRIQTLFELLIYAYLIYSVSTLNQTLMIHMNIDSISMHFCACIILLSLIVLIKNIKSGFWKFTLQDRQRLLLMPISPRHKLFFGVINRIGTTVKIVAVLFVPIAIFLQSVSGKSLIQCILFELCTVLIVAQYYGTGLVLSLVNDAKTKTRLTTIFLMVMLASLVEIVLIIAFDYTSKWAILFVPLAGWYIRIAIEIIQQTFFIDASLIISVVFSLSVAIFTAFCIVRSKITDALLLCETKPKQHKAMNSVVKETKHCYKAGQGANSVFHKQLHELKNRKKSIIFDLKTVFFCVLTAIITIGLCQTVDANGNPITFDYLLIIICAISTVLCMYIGPDTGYDETDVVCFRLLPLNIYAKAFFASAILYLRSAVLYAVAIIFLLAFSKTSISYLPVSIVLFMGFMLICSASPFLFKRFAHNVMRDTLVSIYIRAILNIVLLLPSVMLFLFLNMCGASITICSCIVSVYNAIMFCVMINISRRVLR